MTTSNIIVIGIVLTLLSILSFMLLKVSNKEYPKTEEEQPKFEPRKIRFVHKEETETAPKRKYKKKRKKKSAVAKNETTEKRPVGRPKKSN